MSLWERIAGSALGVMLAGPLSSLIGTLSDKLMAEDPDGDALTTQTLMFSALWTLAGHVAKIDGRVTVASVRAAETLMQRMALNRLQRRTAISLFEQGKAQDFPRATMARRLRRACGVGSQLPASLLGQLVLIAQADGELSAPRRAALQDICMGLGLAHLDLARMLGEAPARRPRPARPPSADAYAILGLKPGASMDEITRAYRRLINRHHPDKLHGGSEPHAIREAEERTRAIRGAFETLRAKRSVAVKP